MDFIAFFVTLLVTLPILATMRNVLARRTQSLMMTASKAVGALPDSLAEKPEVPATTVPALAVTELGSLPSEAVAARTTAAAERASEINRFYARLWRHEAPACLFYVVFPWLISLLPMVYAPVLPGGIGTVSWVLAGIGLALTTSRVIFYDVVARRYQTTYRKPRGVRRWDLMTRAGGMILLGWFRVALHPVLGFVGFCFFWVAWVGELFTIYLVSVPQFLALGLAGLCHAALIWRAYRRTPADRNRKLLILRVFDLDRTAFLTFDYLLSYWRHFGTDHTVVDPAYLRYKYRGVSSENIAVCFFALYGFATIYPILYPYFEFWVYLNVHPSAVMLMHTAYEVMIETPMMGFAFAVPVAVVGIVIGYLLRFAIIYRRAPDYFAKNTDQIRSRIAQLGRRPQNLDRTFRELHMYCFDNTWRIAVAEFVEQADVVLMDLRGFTDDRSGCEYEVDFLFDTISIDRIVFLAGYTAQTQNIHTLIRERWAHLRDGSPNLRVKDPVAHVYVAHAQTTDDVQGLADMLLWGASGRAHAPA